MDKYWVWFSRLLQQIGVKTQNKLLERYKTPEKIWQLKKDELQKIIEEKEADSILEDKYRKDLNRYIDYMEKNEIKMITINDDNYPYKLKTIYDPPVVLYVKGTIEILNQKSIAIIGSRNCSDYGKNVAKEIAYNLSKHNINIVSGLAVGIDKYAHIGAILAKQKTIAILGNSLDKVYPQENIEVYNKIIESGGAVVSEYIVGTKTEKLNFPARNRIVSGISDGVLVVEANKKSRNFNNCRFCIRTR